MALLELEHISHRYEVGGILGGRRGNQVLFDVSLSLETGSTIALVGESGCGKTTLGKIAADAVTPSEGAVRFDGHALRGMSKEQYLAYRRAVQFIHQEPYASLNPTHTVLTTLGAPLRRHHMVRTGKEAVSRVAELLALVGLTPVADFLHKYPHQLSGGQRQRVSIARAVALNPRVIVADEAVSMVDVSLRVGLLDLLLDLQRRLGLACLFVSHDFGVVRYFAQGHTAAVMYLGHVVEIGPAEQVISHPLHPYTRALIAAVPVPDPGAANLGRDLPILDADPPSTPSMVSGCKFHPRCPYAVEQCRREVPALEELEQGHHVACYVARSLLTGTLDRAPQGAGAPSAASGQPRST